MLRSEVPPRVRLFAVLMCAVVGGLAAALVLAGNLGNMGLCGACFLRDLAGALGLTSKSGGPSIFRPEIVGVVLGATLLAVIRRRFVARSGSYAAARFALGFATAIGAMVFLGCPFRMLQRLGGGDPHAWFALPGFVVGVFVATLFERRGYAIGKTAVAPTAVGVLGPATFGALCVAYLAGGFLFGPGLGSTDGPLHADGRVALGIALVAGVLLSATGFCAISAARSIFRPPRAMLLAAGALILGYATVVVAAGRFSMSFDGQPGAHGDVLWNAAALALLGLAGALAGGCPVRQLVMTGEGNGDAFVAALGIVAGGAFAHNFGLVSAPATAAGPGGPTDRGRIAVAAGLVLCAVFAAFVVRAHARATAERSRQAGVATPI